MTTGADAATARGLGAVTLGLAAAALLVQAWRGGRETVPREAPHDGRGDARRRERFVARAQRRVRTRAHALAHPSACAPVLARASAGAQAVAHPSARAQAVAHPSARAQAVTHPSACAQVRTLPIDGARRASLAAALGAPDGPARGLHAAAALLAASVLADSAVEHARGGFDNPGMITPLLAALAALLAGASGAARARPARAHGGVYGTALAVGAAGTAFHVYNLLARPGGIGWANLFYGAPLGAPAALSLAGVLGLGALRSAPGRADPSSSGRALCGIVCGALLGTSAEVALLHFRGAYHNPFMWLPVAVPPVAAALVGAHAIAPAPASRRLAHAWLALTGLLGIGGMGFHAYGVARQKGGWRNWRQNILSGPPLSAPPSFTALALAGLSALALLGRRLPTS